MGNLDFSANADQLKELATYMASQINVPTIGIGGGYAPIGTIISVMGTTAPQDYLACDGTVYNIADYPQLADYFESQFGESNHFGGDGTTTFAVPDLQGEFLRGTGTNSHANQGSGANVGVHQDGTERLNVNTTDTGNVILPVNAQTRNTDSTIQSNGMRYIGSTALSDTFSVSTSRPTNTSVLYCIKAVVAGEVYSTEERVVGTWIDGKPLYQKTFAKTMPIWSSGTGTLFISEAASNDYETMVDFSGVIQIGQNDYAKINGYIGSVSGSDIMWFGEHNGSKGLVVVSSITNRSGKPVYVTVQYTKTTD